MRRSFLDGVLACDTSQLESDAATCSRRVPERTPHRFTLAIGGVCGCTYYPSFGAAGSWPAGIEPTLVPVARDWKTWLRNAAVGPSDAEKDRRDRTERRIREAIAASPGIPGSDVRVFAKGSYANNTNVRLDADVDIAVEWTGWFYTAKEFEAKGLENSDLQLVDIPPDTPPSTSADWRSRVERALVDAFGSSVDSSGDKAVTVAGDAATLDADVVPCYRLRRYDSKTVFNEGIRLFPKSGGRIDNWPQQNLENGRAAMAEEGLVILVTRGLEPRYG